MSDSAPNFLGLAEDPGLAGPARCRILPIPYEATVSYESGTSDGPRAILRASTQVEFYDREFGCDPCAHYGIETLDAIPSAGDGPRTFVDRLAQEVAARFDPDRLFVGLGGEHTVTAGLVRGTARALERPLTLVQIDAHADLRNEYESNPWSHACVTRRLLEEGIDRVVQLGVRSLCSEEAILIDEDPRIHVHWAEDISTDSAGGSLEDLRAQVEGREVYLTIDVDGLDPSVIPATGTPEPNGLSWQQVVDIVRVTTRHASVVGMDIVELAPRAGLHHADFAAAKLTYHAMNCIAASRGWLP